MTASRRRRRPAGFSLVELLVVLVLMSVVVGGLMSVLVRQQRFYRGTADLVETRSQIRQAAGIIPSDLRGVSTIGGDIISMSDTSLHFWATIGSAVTCVWAASSVVVPPLVLSNNNTLASFTTTPQAGDTVFIYDDGLTEAAVDDRWRAYGLTSGPATSSASCTQLTGLADLTTPRYSFNVDRTIEPTTLLVGAPMRFVRRTQYSLYLAIDGSWYLGYCSPNCGGGNPQPIAGPFLPGDGGSAGVSFSYQNEAGAVTAIPANVAQVSIVVRGKTRGVVDLGGYKNTNVGDSLRFIVAIRNRR